MRRNHATVLFLILIVSLPAVSIPQAAAPPLGYGYTCGLISALGTDISISHATVNVAIIPDSADGENLTHHIEVLSRYNLTNMADNEVGFLTSYVRTLMIPDIAFTNLQKNISIEGNSFLYNATIDYNISTQTGLPAGIGSRYPSGIFSSYMNPRIDVVNLTVAAHAELVLVVRTIFVVKCIGNFFDFRYGLDMSKLETDSTQLDGRFDVSNTSLLVRTEFLNSHSRSVNQVVDSLVARWSISDWDWGGESTYPGFQMDDDVFNDYFGVQLWQSEYLPPTQEFRDLPWSLLIVLIIITIATLILLAARSRWNK